MLWDVEFNSGAFYPAATDVRLAEIAEERGFDAVWKGESNSTDPLVLLSGMASRTRRIKLGTAIYHIYGRSPVTLGIQAATLNDLSDGRVLLGLGVANRAIASWHQGSFDRPLGRIREYVDVVRSVARGEKVDYPGEIYPVHGFKLSWRPAHPELRVYYAGLGTQMTRLAGKIANGIIMNMANPAKIREIVANVRAGATGAGRDPNSIDVCVKVRVAMHRDREVARRKLKQVLTFYNLADHYKDMVAGMGFAEGSAAIRAAYATGGFKAAAAAVPDEMLAGLPTIAATSVDEVRERIGPYAEAGATRLIIPFVPCGDDPGSEAERFLRAWR
ncbi:MAG TPA: LLM class flavin-dependent oxidoreductase [Candidatus Limnocylindria bacterium]|nr:LLM class flavin-dependent oxidoreductase [Candidatus Limnocylindria bacterium]